MARDPEAALRNLLLGKDFFFGSKFPLTHDFCPHFPLPRHAAVFPFLPIDAGEGADRVIRALARLYLDTHPAELLDLRARTATGSSMAAAASTATDAAAAVTPATAAAAQSERHDDAESAVYILIYAVIMLNTDLHHPAIRTKMTAGEFVRSTRSTVLGEAFGEVSQSVNPTCFWDETPSRSPLPPLTPLIGRSCYSVHWPAGRPSSHIHIGGICPTSYLQQRPEATQTS